MPKPRWPQGVRAEVGQGTVHAPAGFAQGHRGQALDVRSGGYVTFPYDPAFDLSGELTLAFWMKLDTLSAMPVLVSCGEWQKNGWFLQVIGNRFRFYVGGPNVLDAGAPETGRWMHVAAVYDGTADAAVSGRQARRQSRDRPGRLHAVGPALVRGPIPLAAGAVSGPWPD